jgi:hypothetical protein
MLRNWLTLLEAIINNCTFKIKNNIHISVTSFGYDPYIRTHVVSYNNEFFHKFVIKYLCQGNVFPV